MHIRIYPNQTDAAEHLEEFGRIVQEQAKFFGLASYSIAGEVRYQEGDFENALTISKSDGEIGSVLTGLRYALGGAERASEKFLNEVQVIGYHDTDGDSVQVSPKPPKS